jgi:hypothetical protein
MKVFKSSRNRREDAKLVAEFKAAVRQFRTLGHIKVTEIELERRYPVLRAAREAADRQLYSRRIT